MGDAEMGVMPEEQTAEEEATAAGSEETQEDATLAEDAAQTGEEEQGEESKVVPVKALQSERMKRQQLQKEAELLRNQMLLMQQQMAQQRKPEEAPKDELSHLRDDDPITKGEMQKMLQTEQKRREQDEIQRYQVGRKAEIQNQITQAKQEYEDFDEVFALADDLCTNDPRFKGMETLIAALPNAAQAAYILGKFHPKYQDKGVSKKAKETISKINKNLTQPKTLSGVGGGKSVNLDYMKRIAEMSDAELDAEIERTSSR